MMKRRAFKLLLFLLLGAIINVAVAWGFASLAQIPRPLYVERTECLHQGLFWSINGLESFPTRPRYSAQETLLGVTRIEFLAKRLSTSDARIRGLLLQRNRENSTRTNDNLRARLLREEILRDEELLDNAEIGKTNAQCELLELRFGLPLRSMSGFRWKESDVVLKNQGVVYAIECGWRPYVWQPWITELRFLPIRPIWPGFAINTTFYAAIVWGLFAMAGHIKRRRRIKRGLCVKCAYPVGVTSAVCSECGTPVHPRNATHGAAALGAPATPGRDFR